MTSGLNEAGEVVAEKIEEYQSTEKGDTPEVKNV